MRSYLILGAAALVAASPAPQGFDFAAVDAVQAPAQGPPVGPGPAEDVSYNQGEAQGQAAAAAAAPASAQLAKKSAGADLEARTFWWLKPKPVQPNPGYPVVTPAPTPTTTAAPTYNPTSTNTAPDGCTPVSWTNTWAFTADPACPTAIEVGTYCGFINPLDPCAAQPNAYGPPTVPDTVDAFKSNTVYSDLAKNAKTPTGYAQAFSNLQGSVEGSGYLSYKLLTSYDPAACAAYCDETKTCTGFNIFIERDPKFNQEQCSCQASSITQFKCSIWGQEVKKEAATNKGGNQGGFEVVVVGSNGYNKATYTPPTLPPSCSKPQDCGHKLHNQQPYCIGQKTFPGPFDPTLCYAYAAKQNIVNKKAGWINLVMSMFGMNKSACVQFQAAYIEKAGHGVGTHCRLFTKKFSSFQANLDISVGGSANFGCQKSFTWDLDVNASFDFNWKRDLNETLAINFE
ncbi:hypothetical protein HBI56_194760 [Parastagonospora nodorum]|nr:hypothetical protein HBH53_189070 [Parastagonospora nodorum]KAH3967124.1 hypothetical protein HBH52_191130 [Parastagonospora nodorum]KAH4157232.1 hypothetical protein HBH43_199740 [Parastagonospora nodorum]KAH4193873.1 hypothetical protein HBI95_202150 [Parastagonospora nodorum]KAH4291531.1 hypothetical protein HBI01_189950 [Parastagonospora nodorum]